MSSVIAVFVSCSFIYYSSDRRQDSAIIRVIGGEKAADVWVPRFVFNHKTICAGVTLTAEADLTSATCLDDDEPLEAFVVVESHGQNEPPVQVAHIDRCVKFDKEQQHVHDLMVCFHHCQWNFSRDVFVPSANLENDGMASEFDEQCSVMGFGHVTPEGDKCNILHTMEIQMGTLQDCGSHDDSVQNYVCGATAEQQVRLRQQLDSMFPPEVDINFISFSLIT
ncbi:uncharacterized protein LOC126426485 [Schistocerca serialis cubense]|uniref:uncharacterized protein LOC126426485 n=1 Tax=Schistocerca serialis cubense TaxID=2023355 RepID=UPI00214E14EF|nr:uncharacterized protein LOC126426485 [Schistocerca serialis cubense]